MVGALSVPECAITGELQGGTGKLVSSDSGS